MSEMMAIERNEMFDLAFKFVTETNENIFLTGKAGTGKTTFLKYLQNNCAKNMIIAAPTGVAAINAGGVTLHSLFHLPFHPFIPSQNGKNELLAKLRYNKQKQDLLRKMEILVIDEISMVRADVMDEIDTILRSVRRNHAEPFGGVQLLCIGDLHQLPPVAQHHEWSILQDYYSTPFFFDSLAVKEQIPLLIELDKIYRQKEDVFIRLLNKVRNNQMDQDDLEDLNMRFDPSFIPGINEGYITLTSHNKQADLINQVELNKLTDVSFIYKAEIDGDFPESAFPAEKELELKAGSQVMFLKNDVVQKRYFNGKIGTVKSLNDTTIIVTCNGTDITVAKETWENSRYKLNREDGKLEQENLGNFIQYPLRLAWAITIHKSQGLTFDHLMIDASSSFSSGQVYVALSRCTSLEGIKLLTKIPSTAIKSNDLIVKGQQNLKHKGSLAERFEGARQLFTQQIIEQVFVAVPTVQSLQNLVALINFHLPKLNPAAADFIRDLSPAISKLQGVGKKFYNSICLLLKENPLIEQNTVTQQRIKDAAVWFLPNWLEVNKMIEQNQISTELRETATPINEALVELYLIVHQLIYQLEYCKSGFGLSSFLHHKIQYATPKTSLNIYASAKNRQGNSLEENELLDTLFRWRDHEVQDTGLPIYMVCNQTTLKEISEFRPLNKKDLLKIKGFGGGKVAKYGDEILEMVSDYCERTGLETNMKAIGKSKQETVKRATKVKTPTHVISYQLFQEGRSIDEIALERSFAASTIEGHLFKYVQLGEMKLEDLIDPKKIELVKTDFEKFGLEGGFVSAKDRLGEAVSFNDLRMVVTYLKDKTKQDQ